MTEVSVDTPLTRITINQLDVEELDKQLEQMRARRLIRVQKLEALAHAKADDVKLKNYILYEKLFARTKRALKEAMEEEKKIDDALHKLRVLVFKMQEGA